MILRSGQAGSMSFQVITLLSGCPDRLELLDGERFDEVVLGIDDQRDSVVSNQKSRPVDPLCFRLRFLGGLGLPRGIDDVDFALHILAEAGARAVIVDDDHRRRVDSGGRQPAAAMLIR